MKRSKINALLKDAVDFMQSMQIKLPPFAYFTPEEWAKKDSAWDEIRDNMLGWDITDFGGGDFLKKGLLLFTMRNGNLYDDRYTKPYAEKYLIVEEGQVTPFHFHWKKMEDIINRGGGNLLVQVYNDDGNGGFADTPVKIMSDGHHFTVPAGEILRLTPGQSISIYCGMYHSFWGEEGSGKILLGEVSQVNDDNTDNRFYEKQGRFPEIEEDAVPLYLLCNEYPKAK